MGFCDQLLSCNHVFKVHLCYSMYQNFILSLWLNSGEGEDYHVLFADIWVAPTLGPLWTIILWTFMHNFFFWCEHMFWVLLELPYHMASLCLTFWGTSKIAAFISYEIRREKWHAPGGQRQGTSVPGWILNGSTNLGMFYNRKKKGLLRNYFDEKRNKGCLSFKNENEIKCFSIWK